MADKIELHIEPILDELEVDSKSFNTKNLKKVIDTNMEDITNSIESIVNNVGIEELPKNLAKQFKKTLATSKSFAKKQANLFEKASALGSSDSWYQSASSQGKQLANEADVRKQYDAYKSTPGFADALEEYKQRLTTIEKEISKKEGQIVDKENEFAGKLSDIQFKYVMENNAFSNSALESWSATDYAANGESYKQAYDDYQAKKKILDKIIERDKAYLKTQSKSLINSISVKGFNADDFNEFAGLEKQLDRFKEYRKDLKDIGTDLDSGGVFVDPVDFVATPYNKKNKKDEYSEVQSDLKTTQSESTKLYKSISDLNTAFANSGNSTNSASEGLKQIAKDERDILKLTEQIKERNATGRGINPNVANYRAGELTKRYSENISNQKSLNTSGKSYIMPDFGNATKDNAELESRMQKYINLLKEAQTAGKSQNKFLNILRTSFGKLAAGVTAAAASIKIFAKEKKAGFKSDSFLKTMYKDFLQLGLGIRSIYYAVKQFRTVLIDALTQMAGQVPEVNAQLSSIMTALNGLKGSLATAFQPIISMIVPILNVLINALNSAMNAIARFFATISGQGFIYKFTAANQDLASSISGAGSAASDANKDLERTLLSFDKMNKLQKNDDSSGGGGGGGGGSNSMGSWAKNTQNAYSKLAALMKKGWENSDFTKVGQYLGKKLKSDLETLQAEYIPKWSAFLQKLGDVTATFFNGFNGVKELGNTIGETIADLVNMITSGLNNFLTKFDAGKLGKLLGNLVGSAIMKINISDLLTSIALICGKLLKAISSTAVNLVRTIDFGELATKIVDGIFNAIKAGLGDASFVGDIFETLVTLFFGAINMLGTAILELFKQLGLFVIDGFKDGIWNGIKNIGKWIYDNIIMPVVNGFKSGLGIASPSKVLKDIGKFTIEGFLQGILNKIKNFPTWLANNVIKVVKNAFEAFKKIKNAFTVSIKTKFADTKKSLSNKWQTLTADIKDIVKEAKLKIPQVWSNLKARWNGLTNNIKHITKNAKMSIPQTWNDLKSRWTSLTSHFKNIAATATLTLHAQASERWNNAATKLNAAKKKHPKLLGWLPELPYLAQGAVIPPNSEFLAVLGDQKHGTNIETPLETMVQAFNMALQQSGFSAGNGDVNVYLEGDAKTLFRVIRKEANNYTQSTGKAAFNY